MVSWTQISKVKDHIGVSVGERGGDSGLRRKAATLFSVILLIALVVGSLFGDRGFLYLVQQRQRADALAREVADVRAENARLGEEISALKQDPRAVERLAREELGLVQAGETVFLIRDDTPGRP
jgi:cell division protein FtsB